jgi:hypothetical protein
VVLECHLHIVSLAFAATLSPVFGHYYLQNATSMVSSLVEGKQKETPPEHRDHGSLRHRRTEDRELEYPLHQSPLRQLEDQTGEIMELLKWWKEEREDGAGVEGFSGEEVGNTSFGV